MPSKAERVVGITGLLMTLAAMVVLPLILSTGQGQLFFAVVLYALS